MKIQLYRYRFLNRTSTDEGWRIQDFTSVDFPWSDEDIKDYFETIRDQNRKYGVEYTLIPTSEKKWLTERIQDCRVFIRNYEEKITQYKSLLDSLGSETLGTVESSNPDKPQEK